MFTLTHPFMSAWLAWSRPVFTAWGYAPRTLDAWARAPAHAAMREQDLQQKLLAQSPWGTQARPKAAQPAKR